MRYAIRAATVIAAMHSCLPAFAAAPCLSDTGDQEQASGKVTIERAKDAAGRPQQPYILVLSAPACLLTDDPADKVDASDTIHIFSTNETVQRQIGRSVGLTVVVVGKPFPAHTAHHHAPIVMDISEIRPR